MNITIDLSEAVSITLIVAIAVVASLDSVHYLLKYRKDSV